MTIRLGPGTTGGMVALRPVLAKAAAAATLLLPPMLLSSLAGGAGAMLPRPAAAAEAPGGPVDGVNGILDW